MFSITTVTPPATEPVSTATLKLSLRLNTTAEDSLLADYITTARQQFEFATQLPVITQTLRQYVHTLGSLTPATSTTGDSIFIMRGNVTSISSVHYYDASDALQTSSTHSTDIISSPARVWWPTLPGFSSTLPNIAYVDFVAGYASAGATPADIKTAIMLLAGHYYANREAYVTDNLNTLPMGFQAITQKYACKFLANWGM